VFSLPPFSPRQLTLFSDCQALVAQMTGKSPVRRPELQVLNLRLRIHMHKFESVVLQHIPTEWNQQACSVSWRVIENDLVN